MRLFVALLLAVLSLGMSGASATTLRALNTDVWLRPAPQPAPSSMQLVILCPPSCPGFLSSATDLDTLGPVLPSVRPLITGRAAPNGGWLNRRWFARPARVGDQAMMSLTIGVLLAFQCLLLAYAKTRRSLHLYIPRRAYLLRRYLEL